MKNKRTIGSKYEKIAGQYLEQQGYLIVEYNFHSRFGEIDIIAKHEGYLVFGYWLSADWINELSAFYHFP